MCGVVGLLALLGASFQPLAAQGDDPAGFPRRVTDARGVLVTIPAFPARVAVVGSDPALAAVIPAADLQPVDPGVSVQAADWTNAGLLVVPTWAAAAYPALLAQAESAAIPVLVVEPVNSLASWSQAITRFGYATGRGQPAAAALNRLAAQVVLVETWIVGREPVPALVLTPEGYTFGQGAYITELIAAAGGVNTAAVAGYADYRQIDDVVVRALAPAVILLSPAWDVAALLDNPAYADLPAVQAGRVYQLPFSPTQPPDPGAALVTLAAAFHPGAVITWLWSTAWEK